MLFGYGLNDLMNLGTLGSIFFLLSWILQGYESKKAGKSIVGLKFWLLRLTGTILILIYTIQLRILIFILVDIATLLIVVYNIYLILKIKLALVIEDYVHRVFQW